MVELLLPKQLTRVRFPSPAPSFLSQSQLTQSGPASSLVTGRRAQPDTAMKIAILSRNASLYSTRRLVDAARSRGHSVRVLDPLRCYMRISRSGFDMHYKGRPLSGFDAVIPRIGSSITFYGTAVLRQFEMMGVYTPNSSDAVLRSRDKLRSLQLLARQGIDLPMTVFGDYPDDTADLLQMLGDPPHVIKLNEGTQGQGVLLAEKRSASQGHDRGISRPVCQFRRAGVHRRSRRR